MIEFIRMGGIPMYVLTVIAAAILILALRAAWQLRTLDRPHPHLESGIDSVLFWGAYAAILGLLGTAVGVFQAGDIIQRTGGVSTALAWSGIRVALTTSIAGLAVFSLSFLAWYALRAGYHRRTDAYRSSR